MRKCELDVIFMPRSKESNCLGFVLSVRTFTEIFVGTDLCRKDKL